MDIPSNAAPLWRTSLLDWIYPPVCTLCEVALRGDRCLCDSCSDAIPRIVIPFCDVCGESFPGQIEGSFECPNCTGLSFHFEFARAALDRSDEALELIHRLKYGRQIHLARELGRLASEAFTDRRLALVMEDKWPLVPVPLHPSRKRERYFNQAEEIALAVSEETGLAVENRLRRVRKTVTQTRLSRAQRMENLKGAFETRRQGRFLKTEPYPPSPGAILIDDVFTTGSTVDACAKVLKASGVERVAVLTVLRG